MKVPYTHIYVEVDSGDGDIVGKLSLLKKYDFWTPDEEQENYNYLLKLIQALKEKGRENYPCNLDFYKMYNQFNSSELDFLYDIVGDITPNPKGGWSNFKRIDFINISEMNTVLKF